MRRILLVEDEKMIRYGIYVMLENSGIPYKEIIECHNGEEAKAYLENEMVDLVITDIKMPFMGGIELAQWIDARISPETKPYIVAISGFAEFEYVRTMLKCQAVDYLLKPVEREELTKVLWKIEELYLQNKEKRGIKEISEKTDGVTQVSKKKVEMAIEYILKNYANPIDMAEVSNYVSMNYSMFSTMFKECMGENFCTFLRKTRIEKSKKLLCNTVMSVAEVAESVGFEDGRRFAKVFKEETGQTPTDYRIKKN